MNTWPPEMKLCRFLSFRRSGAGSGTSPRPDDLSERALHIARTYSSIEIDRQSKTVLGCMLETSQKSRVYARLLREIRDLQDARQWLTFHQNRKKDRS